MVGDDEASWKAMAARRDLPYEDGEDSSLATWVSDGVSCQINLLTGVTYRPASPHPPGEGPSELGLTDAVVEIGVPSGIRSFSVTTHLCGPAFVRRGRPKPNPIHYELPRGE